MTNFFTSSDCQIFSSPLQTSIPNISNIKISNWVNSASFKKFESIEQSSEYISVLDNRSEVESDLVPQNKSFDVGFRVQFGRLITQPLTKGGQAIIKWLQSRSGKSGFLNLIVTPITLLINMIVGLLIFILHVFWGFFNTVSYLLLPIWVYLVNLIRSKWEQVHVDLHLKIPMEEETKRKNPFRKRQNSSKIMIKNYKGFLDKIPIQIYKEETCMVRIDLSCKPQQDTKKQSKKQESNSSFLDTFLNRFKSQISESSFSKEIELDKKADYSLQFDLSSPEFKVIPSEKQNQSLDLEKLSYKWNCKFSNTGKHKLDLVIRVVEQSDSSKIQKILEREYDVRVVQIFGLTKDQTENFAKGVLAFTVTVGLIRGIIQWFQAVF